MDASVKFKIIDYLCVMLDKHRTHHFRNTFGTHRVTASSEKPIVDGDILEIPTYGCPECEKTLKSLIKISKTLKASHKVLKIALN